MVYSVGFFSNGHTWELVCINVQYNTTQSIVMNKFTELFFATEHPLSEPLNCTGIWITQHSSIVVNLYGMSACT